MDEIVHQRRDDVFQHRWINTFLATMGATLTCALLLWIASNQMAISTQQAVLQRDFQAQALAFAEYNVIGRNQNTEVKEWFREIWPRLRVHDENVTILQRHVQELCNCQIPLNKPDKF